MAARRCASMLLALSMVLSLHPSPATGEEHPPGSLDASRRAAAPLKSPTKAQLLSLGSFVVPTAAGITVLVIGDDKGNESGDWNRVGGTMLGLGAIFGPAVGYFYADDAPRGFIGIGIRGGVTLGSYVIASSINNDGPTLEGLALLVLVPAVILASATVDILQVRGRVERRNERLSGVEPVLVPLRSSDALAIGLRVGF